MQTLGRVLAGDGAAGAALPTAFPSLERAGIRLRRGQVTMLAAAPNVGKSILAIDLVVKMRVPALFMSADTDDFTTTRRVGSLLTGYDQDQVENMMADRAWREWFGEQMDTALDWLRFSFEPSPSVDDIFDEVLAFDTVYGEPPHMLVVDNLLNVENHVADEYRGLRLILKEMHTLARETGASVLVLHHVTGEFEDGLRPPPRKAVQGKVSQLPELILTAGRDGDLLGGAAVKNRLGPMDATGNTVTWFEFHPERMIIRER